jgi:signal transduction histidine kinase
MIRTIWIRIMMVLALAVLPAMLLQFKLQSESVALVFDLAERTQIRSAIDTHLATLRETAKQMPAKEDEYRRSFEEGASVKRSVEEFFLARESIDGEIRDQTIIITATILFVSLLLSIFISRSIVSRFQVLLIEKEKAVTKVKDLSALQNWQTIARILVHELRAPITPIKLVVSDLDRKYASLDSGQFRDYLTTAKSMVSEQVNAIETMIRGFTTFGQLPPPQLQNMELKTFLTDFVKTYQGSFGPDVKLTIDSDSQQCRVLMDSKLMRDLFFNLVKNAAEANDSQTSVTINICLKDNMAEIFFRNTGVAVPDTLKDRIFDPYVTTKAGEERSNMGLGLTICRKIALDHGGDLSLEDSGPHKEGATFRVEIPAASADTPKG